MLRSNKKISEDARECLDAIMQICCPPSPLRETHVEAFYVTLGDTEGVHSIMKPLGTSLLILNNTEKILLFLRDDKPEIPYPNMWDIPGGHVEPNETPEQCILREMKEEMDLDLTPPDLFLITEFPDRMEHTFWCQMNPNIDEIRLMEGQYLQWFTEAEAAETELACGFNQVVATFFGKRPWYDTS